MREEVHRGFVLSGVRETLDTQANTRMRLKFCDRNGLEFLLLFPLFSGKKMNSKQAEKPVNSKPSVMGGRVLLLISTVKVGKD